ncbi:MAG TPA: M20/M25/M40 family metallo-hydrolase [Gemmatimonadaceae bacterium]
MTLSRIRISAALMLSAATPLAAQSSSRAIVARDSARAFRERSEAPLVREFAELLSLKNLASDSADIRRNGEYLVGMLGRRGFRNIRLLTVPGGPPAVYGELPAPGAKRTLVLYAHYDGQPVDTTQWTNPPWSPTLRARDLKQGGAVIPWPRDGERVDPESRLYARSAGDDKASIMAILGAVDALHATHISPSVNLKVFFEGEEEASSPHLAGILRTYAPLLTGDGWIFCDGPVHQSGLQQLSFGQRGVTGLELTVYGATRALHSGHYGNWAPNPAVLVANLIASMRDDDGHIKIAGYYDDVRPISPAEHRAIAALPPYDSTLRRMLGLAKTEANNALLAERIMLPALNVRGVRAGGVQQTASNTISTVAYASFDFRLVPRQTPQRVRQLVEAHLARQGFFVTTDTPTVAMRLAHPRIARVEWEDGYPAQRVPMDGPFGAAVLHVLAEGAPRPPLVNPTVGGSGPAYLFEQILKAPMISLPIANYDDNQHAADENLRIQNLWDGIETYAGLLAGLGASWGQKPTP